MEAYPKIIRDEFFHSNKLWSRNEVVALVKNVNEDVVSGELNLEEHTEVVFSEYLDTREIRIQTGYSYSGELGFKFLFMAVGIFGIYFYGMFYAGF